MVAQKRFALCYLTAVLSVTLMYCGQMVGWIKMPLGMEVGLGPGHIVLDGEWEWDPPPPRKRGAHPANFRPMSVVAKRLDGSGYHLVGTQACPRRRCVRWGLSSPHGKGHVSPPALFIPLSYGPTTAKYDGQLKYQTQYYKVLGHMPSILNRALKQQQQCSSEF